MTERNATAAIIGAGDYIGAAIARRFAAAGDSATSEEKRSLG